LSYIIKAISENSIVLDVGCSFGYLGEWLVKNKNCQVYGIDIDKEAVAYVKERRFYKDVFNLDLDYPEKTRDEFDRFADLEDIFDFVILC
jgi:2-polyprenyl-3-methyl-5-hydroxy-6-metoxy-1,4-benzoquinol methylase